MTSETNFRSASAVSANDQFFSNESGKHLANLNVTKDREKSHKLRKHLVLLAQNKDTTKLKLRFFLMKNLTSIELAAGITTEQR